MIRYLTIVGILIQFATAEDLSFVLETTFAGAAAESASITLNQGDTAKLEYASVDGGWSFYMRCNINGKISESRCFKYEASGPPKEINPVTVAGPATIVFRAWGGGNYLATLRITRAGTASPPAAIPQESGSNYDVILESSSDLINWTPTNPGEYSGTEPKRFFRTRIVKKP